MKFIENGWKVYSVLQTSEELVPHVGWHVPGAMGGIWFPPFRVISSMRVAGLGDALSLEVSRATKKVVFERGEVEPLVPLGKRCFMVKISGRGKMEIELGGEREWPLGSGEVVISRSGFEIDASSFSIESTYGFLITPNGFSIPLKGETVLKIFQEPCGSFEEEKGIKERFYSERDASWSGSLEERMRAFLIEMFLEGKAGRGIMAGLEEYPWWFAIDTHFTTTALLKLNLFDLARESLENLIEKFNGELPHEVTTSGFKNSSTESELFAILHSVYEYTKESGDGSLLVPSKHLLEEALNTLERGLRGKGIVEVRGYEGKVLDLHAFAYAMLKLASLFEKDKRIERWLGWFDENFLKEWFNGLTFKGEIHFTQILPLYFGLVPAEVGKRVLLNLERIGMITEKGLKHSLTENETEGYYGNKAEKVWWLANALLKAANKIYGNPLELSNLDELYEEDLSRFLTPPEIVGGDSGCFAQSWSSLFAVA